MNNIPSILFNERDTWADWGLIPSSRPIFSPPSIKSKYIDLPGEDGSLDLTEISGSLSFSERVGTFTFLTSDVSPSITDLCEMMREYLHGKTVRATLSEDQEWFYEGRFTIQKVTPSSSYWEIEIGYICSVYKIEWVYENLDWLWDPFDFEFGELVNYENLLVSGQLEVSIAGAPSDTPFKFTTTSPMTIRYKGIDYQIPAGTTEIPSINKSVPPVDLMIYGNGHITIDYRGRSM